MPTPKHPIKVKPTSSNAHRANSKTVSEKQNVYKRTKDGLEIRGTDTFSRKLQTLDQVGYWLTKLAPFIVAIIVAKVGMPELSPIPIVSNWVKSIVTRYK